MAASNVNRVLVRPREIDDPDITVGSRRRCQGDGHALLIRTRLRLAYPAGSPTTFACCHRGQSRSSREYPRSDGERNRGRRSSRHGENARSRLSRPGTFRQSPPLRRRSGRVSRSNGCATERARAREEQIARRIGAISRRRRARRRLARIERCERSSPLRALLRRRRSSAGRREETRASGDTCRAWSNFVTGVGVPPAAATLKRVGSVSARTRMLFSAFHEPPTPCAASHTSTRRPATDVDSLELSRSEECDGAAVRRPERKRRPLGAGERARCLARRVDEPTTIRQPFGRRRKNHLPSIGRNRQLGRRGQRRILGRQGSQLHRHRLPARTDRGSPMMANVPPPSRNRGQTPAVTHARRSRDPRRGDRSRGRRAAAALRQSIEARAPGRARSASGPRDPWRGTSGRRDRARAASAAATAEIGGGSILQDRAISDAWRRCPERLPARRHLVEHGSRARRCPCARRPPCPRAAPAPCTGTCRGSCPPRSAARPASASAVSARRLAAAGAMRLARARSRGASRPTSSASRCRASGRGARSPAGAPGRARRRSATP